MAFVLSFVIGIMTGALGNAVYSTYVSWKTAAAVACDVLPEISENLNALEKRHRGDSLALEDVVALFPFKRSMFVARGADLKALDYKTFKEVVSFYSELETLEHYENLVIQSIRHRAKARALDPFTFLQSDIAWWGKLDWEAAEKSLKKYCASGLSRKKTT